MALASVHKQNGEVRI